MVHALKVSNLLYYRRLINSFFSHTGWPNNSAEFAKEKSYPKILWSVSWEKSDTVW